MTENITLTETDRQYIQYLKSEEKKLAAIMENASSDGYPVASARHMEVIHLMNVFQNILRGKNIEDIS